METRGGHCESDAMREIVLLYHDVLDPQRSLASGFPGSDADLYKLERSEFERHLDAIKETGADVRLTFDDGGASAHTVIAPLLEERGWRGHFFIPTDYVGQPGFMGPDEIRDLHVRGHIIGSHSCSHPPRISHCSPNEIEREWRESIGRLSSILGEDVVTASVPGGFYSLEVARYAAAAGIRTLFTSEPVTSVHEIDGCAIVGRYGVQSGDGALGVAALARGDWQPRLYQYLYWNAKKILKRVGGAYWLAGRKKLLQRQARSREASRNRGQDGPGEGSR
jgi:peptidoglycan/xylan/chitin deacetylase (PgdA/CDA1 family)